MTSASDAAAEIPVGWFGLDELPELMAGHLTSIHRALAPAEAAHFEP